ncbi:polysaccharide biosynthesis/export family protein [Methylobacterium nigriterrae]|uniref:polysaccharide biosynthesis/export family protein n=1 Tax=Methylobacterium nigriterrae TaxID=3127512 RepID=UPI003013C618
MTARYRRALSEARRAACASLCLTAAAWTSACLAESRIEAGEVLEVAVLGVPELRQRVTVNRDGHAGFALIGRMNVVGLSVTELGAKVREAMAAKIFRQRTVDGRENVLNILPDEVTVEVVEYRPVYLNGDVSKPGELRYRPGLTVRQAVALGGGYDLVRFRLNNPVMEAADLRAEQVSVSAELARETLTARRLQAELAQKPAPELNVPDMALPAGFVSELVKLETGQQNTREAMVRNEKHAVGRALELSDQQLDVLAQQQEKSIEGSKADSKDLEDVRELQKRGMVPTTRFLEARRSLLYSTTALLQTVAQITSVGREQEELKRRLASIDDQHRLDLIRGLARANVRIVALRARLDSVRQKLTYSAELRSQLLGGGSPEIEVIRKGDQGWAHLRLEEDSELQPGDVIEVALRSRHSPDVAEH